MFTSQPIFCHATAQVLDASTDASLLRGGNCNSHIPAFINTSDQLPMARACPQARDPLCFSLLEVITGQFRVPGWLSQDISWPVLSPWSGFLSSWCRYYPKVPSTSAWEFLSLPPTPADPCFLHSLSQTNVSPANSSRGSPWPLGIPVQSLNYCREVSARLHSSPRPSLSPASFLLVPVTQGSVPLSLPLSQLHCRLPRRSSMETSRQ